MRTRHKALTALAVLAAALGAVTGPAALAAPEAAAPAEPPGTQVSIETFAAKCLDVQTPDSGAPLVQADCDNTSRTQRFWVNTVAGGVEIRTADNLCLDLEAAKRGNGTRIIQYPCGTLPRFSQTFLTFPAAGDATLSTIHTIDLRCFDVANADEAAGAGIIQFTCSGDSNQSFRLREV
ncbi:RICIN domain-containing protein [Streptomyces uncialis]|uniref:RICIN domain-containing protein n=1 Tax=Streptomyces uncialis TaxID=1048205 RepID=UPI00225A54C2|nr:ricin-type beta-trefoil lectin domain protein [Streptomyces uncialis]MCX4659581.1 RICIN domain-containing protein [Streptomyces uncialis]WTE13691.1 RICIN domain-containing protein [Streptomyces uncialis]